MNEIAIRASHVTKYFGKARPAATGGNGRMTAVDHAARRCSRTPGWTG
jgi:hypothetical protein